MHNADSVLNLASRFGLVMALFALTILGVAWWLRRRSRRALSEVVSKAHRKPGGAHPTDGVVQLPEFPAVYRLPKSRIAAVCAVCALIATALAWSRAYESGVGAWVFYLSLFACVIGVIQLHPHRACLTLTAEGFAYAQGFRRQFVPWRIVQSFRDCHGTGLGLVFARTTIGWNYLPGIVVATPRRPLIARLLGFDGLIGVGFEMHTDEFCALLNRIRCHYGSPTPDLWGIPRVP